MMKMNRSGLRLRSVSRLRLCSVTITAFLALSITACGPGPDLAKPPSNPNNPTDPEPIKPTSEDGVITGIITASGFQIKAAKDKTTLCHHTGSSTNPYVLITVDPNAANGQGNNDHSSHSQDIIPIDDRNGDGTIDESDCTAGTGAGIADATVRIEGSDKKTKTNDKGEFRLEGAPVGKKFALVAEKPDVNGKNFKVRKVIRVEAQQKTLNLGSLFLRQTGSLFGQITLAERSDFTGIDVFVAGTTLSSKTDKDGNFAISDVPEGAFQVTAFKEGFVYQTTQAPAQVNAGKPTAVPGMELQVDTAADRFGVLKGTITGDSGPLAGATVSLYGTSLTQSHVAVTDEKGQYVIGHIEPNGSALMPEPQYKVVVHRAFYDTVIDFVELKAGETVTKDLELLSNEVTLGRLNVSVKDCAQQPVSSALIQLDPAPAFAPAPFTDATGKMKFTQLFPGNYTVYAAKGTQKTFEGMVLDNLKTGTDGGLGALAELELTLGDCNQLPQPLPPQTPPTVEPPPITIDPPSPPPPPPPTPETPPPPPPPVALPSKPNAPTGLRYRDLIPNSFTLLWDAVPNAQSYGVWLDGKLHTNGVQNPEFVFKGLNASQTYQAAVSVIVAGQDSDRSSDLSVTLPALPAPPPPPPPTGGGTTTVSVPPAPVGLLTTDRTPESFKLTWNNVSGASHYRIYLGNSQYADNVSGTSYTVSGLKGQSNYSVAVSAFNAGGESPRSNNLSASTVPWSVVWRFWDESQPLSARSRCYANSATTKPLDPPGNCAGYTHEFDHPVFMLYGTPEPGTVALVPYDNAQDHILVEASNTSDIAALLKAGYKERASIGHMWVNGNVPPPAPSGSHTSQVFGLRRYSYPSVGIHLFTINPNETAPGWNAEGTRGYVWNPLAGEGGWNP